MKIDLKLIFLVLIVVVLVSEIDGLWGSRSWFRWRSPSRRSFTSSRRRLFSWRRRSFTLSRRRLFSWRRRSFTLSRRGSFSWRRPSRPKPRPKSGRGSRWWSSRRPSRPKPSPKPGRGSRWWSSLRPSRPKPRPKPGRGSRWWSSRRPSRPKPKAKPGKNYHVRYPQYIKTPKEKAKFSNLKIVSIKQVERPLKDVSKGFYNKGFGNHKLKHTAVIVTTKSGRRYMIEKVNTKGIKKVKITPIGRKGLGPKWRVTKGRGTKRVKNKKMKDFIDATKPGYNVHFNNCQQTSNKLYPLGKRGGMCKG